MKLSVNELQRYQQQINLSEIGIDGQIKLKKAKVAVIGAGGLGTPLLLYLATSGVGTLGIIDHDTIELSNLHRQILYGEKDIGHAKVECAAKKLIELGANTNINIHHIRLTPDNAQAILQAYDIVADCSDNFSTRFLLNDVCFQLDKPLISASIFQFQGQCMTFHGKRGPCLRCLFPDIPGKNEFMNCEQAGVLNVLPGLFGIMQATEILKWILKQGELLIGRVLTVDLLKMQFHEYHLPKNPGCDLCMKDHMTHNHQVSKSYFTEDKTMQETIISVSELKKLLDQHADIQLVDVRTSEKHIIYNIGGIHIPIAELPDRFNELDPEKLIVTYCTSGGNSMRALQLLVSAGFKRVKSLDGGMTAWQVNN